MTFVTEGRPSMSAAAAADDLPGEEGREIRSLDMSSADRANDMSAASPPLRPIELEDHELQSSSDGWYKADGANVLPLPQGSINRNSNLDVGPGPSFSNLPSPLMSPFTSTSQRSNVTGPPIGFPQRLARTADDLQPSQTLSSREVILLRYYIAKIAPLVSSGS